VVGRTYIYIYVNCGWINSALKTTENLTLCGKGISEMLESRKYDVRKNPIE
jgi:hypothetical protein